MTTIFRKQQSSNTALLLLLLIVIGMDIYSYAWVSSASVRRRSSKSSSSCDMTQTAVAGVKEGRKQAEEKKTSNKNTAATSGYTSSSRRNLLAAGALPLLLLPFAYACGATEETSSSAASKSSELPMFLRDYTKLAPLGSKESSSSNTNNNNNNDIDTKSNSNNVVTLEEMSAILERDLRVGSKGRGGYFITGDLSPQLFESDCVFLDPTNRVASLNQYQNALRILFDPSMPFDTQVLSSPVIDSKANTIAIKIRSRGYLQLPWHPYITSYESQITYSINPTTHRIYQQEQTWTKSAYDALKQSFTPSVFAPPPKSSLVVASPEEEEPIEVSQLFRYVNGRRPNEYSVEERDEIDRLIQSIANNNNIKYPYKRQLLTGKWILCYLQPGPNNAGIDRRIPFFPEFDFNDNYQIFSPSTTTTTTTTSAMLQDDDNSNNSSNDNKNNNEILRITNVGELFGPLASVQVSGTVQEVMNRDGEKSPKNQQQRLQANISGGKLCFASSGNNNNNNNCPFDLPISGEGLFDSVYLGQRLRIGQNLNGGGARIVQIRL